MILASILYSLSVDVQCLREGLLSYSESRNRWYSSSPTFTGLPPYYHTGQRIPPIITDCPYLRYQNIVTLFHTHRQSVAGLVKCARTGCEYLRLVQFLHTAFWQEDSTSSLRFGLYPLNQHAVHERQERANGFEGGRLLLLAASPGCGRHRASNATAGYTYHFEKRGAASRCERVSTV